MPNLIKFLNSFLHSKIFLIHMDRWVFLSMHNNSTILYQISHISEYLENENFLISSMGMWRKNLVSNLQTQWLTLLREIMPYRRQNTMGLLGTHFFPISAPEGYYSARITSGKLCDQSCEPWQLFIPERIGVSFWYNTKLRRNLQSTKHKAQSTKKELLVRATN